MNSKTKAGALGASIAVLAWAASTGVAVAQQSVGEIVVTARRSSERLQSIPLAVSVQTSEQLAERGISNLEGLSRFTPSLQFKSFVTTFHGNPTIRGLTQINAQNPVGNVGVFLNNVYLQRGYMVDTSLGDWSRIEVVKGPQSALYGQNTFAGAINYVTTEPSNDFSANASATYGSAGRAEAKLGVGGPIIEDLLMFRAFAGVSKSDGTWKNNAPGDLGDLKDFGGYKREAYSAALKFTPTNNLSFGLFYQNNHREEELRPYYSIIGTFVEDRGNCGPVSSITGRGSLFCGQFPVDPSGYRSGVGTPSRAPYSVDQPSTITNVEVWRANADWQVTDALALHYTYGSANGDAIEDLSLHSNTVNPTGLATISQQHEGGTLKFDSHEARVVWTPALPLSAEVGYYKSHAVDRFLYGPRPQPPGRPLGRVSDDPLVAPPGFFTFANLEQSFDIESFFAKAAIKLIDDRLTLSSEIRHTTTDIEFNDILARTSVPTRPLLTSTYKNWTPRFTADFRVTPQSLVYASAARGVKAGGFNGYQTGATLLNANEQAFGEETNWTYELGTKNTLFGGRLTFNANAFYIDWADKQNSATPANYTPPANPVPGTPAPNIYATIGDAKVWGVEVEGSYRPIADLVVSYSLAYMAPKYGSNAVAASFIGLCDSVICAANGDVSGNQIERASKWAGSLGAEYSRDLTGKWRWFVGGDATYQSKQYNEPTNLSTISGFALFNARLGVENERFKIWAWADNLTDKEYIQSVFYIQAVRQFTASYGDKRTVGVTVQANF